MREEEFLRYVRSILFPFFSVFVFVYMRFCVEYVLATVSMLRERHFIYTFIFDVISTWFSTIVCISCYSLCLSDIVHLFPFSFKSIDIIAVRRFFFINEWIKDYRHDIIIALACPYLYVAARIGVGNRATSRRVRIFSQIWFSTPITGVVHPGERRSSGV